MLTSRRLSWAALLLAGLFTTACGSEGAQGPKGDPGPAGDTGSKGDPGTDGKDGTDGTDAVTTGDVTGTVTDGTSPIQNVDVTVSPGTATAKTDTAGKFDLKGLDIGAYTLTFKATGYLDQSTIVTVTAKGTTTVNVSLAVDEATWVPPTVAVTDNYKAGFGQAVSVKATATGTGPFTYEWKQTSGPTVTLTGADTDTIGFTTVTFAVAKGDVAIENARFGVVGIDADQAGNYVFEVTVTDAHGKSTKADVMVNATRPTTGLRMVPVGIPVWLQGDGALATSTVTGATAPQTTWNWTIDVTGAPGSTAMLAGATGQFPSFTPDVKGKYLLKETVANKTMTIYAGTWLGEMTADGSAPSTCGTCHSGGIAPDTFSEWNKTNHYKGLANKLDGITTQHFTEECMTCHTVGYDKTAANGGFDDVEGASGWTFPTKLQAGNWTTLVNNATLGPLAGIQCENCHGPQVQPSGGPHTSSTGATPDVGARVSWSSDVCASCHQEKPFHYKPSQWEMGGHANRELAIGEGSVEKNANNAPHCGRCHAAQGYARYVGQLKQGYYAYLTSDGKPLDPAGVTNHKATTTELSAIGMNMAQVESVTCQTCHDPHNSTNPSQLRIYDGVAVLPNGMTNVSGMGSGMICATCHNSRNGEHTDFVLNATDTNGKFTPTTLSAFGAPHASAQTDMVYGFNAFFMPRYSPSAHLAVKDTCAGCHYGVATDANQAAKETTNHSFKVDNTICAACHAESVNGDALQAANQLQIDGLFSLLAKKTLDPIKAWMNAPNPQFYVRAYDPVSATYSGSSSTTSTVAITTIPTSIDWYWLGSNTAMLVLHLSAPVTYTTTTGVTVTTSDVYTNVSAVRTGNANNATQVWNAATANAANVQIMYKSYWNGQLLRNDNTKGVHNPTFFNDVAGKTQAVLMTLP